LKTHKDKLKTIPGPFWSVVQETCQDMQRWTKTDLRVGVIEDIYCIVSLIASLCSF
jgi:hypothetical protein